MEKRDNVIISKEQRNKILKLFLKEFWFAPQDAFLRTTDTLIWKEQKFVYPVLDIGCGDARISKLLFKGRKKIDVGLDMNEKEVKNAEKSRFYKTVVCADAAKMPFKDNSFWTVVSNSTFEHIRKDIEGVQEVSRVLKKGGKFLFIVPTKRLKKAILGYLEDKEKLNAYNKRVSHLHYRSLKEWKDILRKSDMEIVNYQSYFPKKAVVAWFKLYRIAIFKPYKRELWSYLKDSPYGKFAPKGMISFLLFKYLERFFDDMYEDKGCWIFIAARKRR